MAALVGDADPAVAQVRAARWLDRSPPRVADAVGDGLALSYDRQYVADAAGLGLARLRREPARLQETAERLQRQQRDVAVEQYHVFLQVD